MSRFASFYGVVGIIFLLFAGIAYLITRDFSFYIFFNTILGVLAVIFLQLERPRACVGYRIRSQPEFP